MNYNILVSIWIIELRYEPSVRSYMVLKNCKMSLHMLKFLPVVAKDIMHVPNSSSGYCVYLGNTSGLSTKFWQILRTPGI